MGFGAYATALLTHTLRALAMARRCRVVAGRRRARGAADRRGHAAPVRPLSRARHHRLGRQPLLHVRQSRCSAATTASPASRRSRIGDLALDGQRASILRGLDRGRARACWRPRNLLDSRVRPGDPARCGAARVPPSVRRRTCRARGSLAFIYAAVLAGLAGWLYAHMQRSVNPTPFGLNAEHRIPADGGGRRGRHRSGRAARRRAGDGASTTSCRACCRCCSGARAITRRSSSARCWSLVLQTRAAKGCGRILRRAPRPPRAPRACRRRPAAARAGRMPEPRRRRCSRPTACARRSAAWSRSTSGASRRRAARSSA